MGQLRARNSTGPFSWKAALLFVITGAGMIVYFRVEKERLERKRIAEMSKGVGRPKVGGPFVLKDLDGKEFTADDLKGKYSFVGFPGHPFILYHMMLTATASIIGLLRLHALPRHLPRRAGQNGRDHRRREERDQRRECLPPCFYHVRSGP